MEVWPDWQEHLLHAACACAAPVCGFFMVQVEATDKPPGWATKVREAFLHLLLL